MPDLFDFDDPDGSRIAAGEAAKQLGIDRADIAADELWKEQMYALTVEVCQTHRQFTSDAIFDLADERGIEQTRERRAFGAIMQKAARAGICRLADVRPRPSNRPALHRSPLSVWDSLIFGGQRNV